MGARAGVVVAVVLGLLGAAPVAPARAEPAAAIAQALPGALLLFDTASPGAVTLREITGLGAKESIVGIDLRPATSQLYVVTVTTGSAANSSVRTYTLDAASGAATLAGVTAAALAGAADLPSGVDFNPTVDRLRLTNTIDENARINPTNGAHAGNDTDLTPASVAVIAAA